MRVSTSTWVGLCAVCVGCALLSACADVTVQRVRPDDFKTKGVRYYLPRPYVAVEKPFPVAGGQYIISGIAGADGAVTIEKRAVPADLAAYFVVFDADAPLTIPAAAILPPVVQAPVYYSQTAQLQGASPDAATPAPKPAVRSAPAEVKWLEGSAATPSILSTSASGFEVSIKLSKAAEFVSIADPVVVLVPKIGDGFDAGSAISLTDSLATTAFEQGKTDGLYKVRGRRSDLTKGSMYAVGLRFKGKASANTDPVDTLIHTAGISLFAEGVAPAPKKPETKTEDSTERITEAGATFAGAADSKPVVPVSEYFQIVYLPDFDQQYAVRASGGLGVAKLNMALENGWQAERITTEIDNRELGRFIFRQIDKFTDIGAAALKGMIAPVAAAVPTENVLQGASEGTPVLLRITYMIEAQPGIYPVLKPDERTILDSKTTTRTSTRSGLAATTTTKTTEIAAPTNEQAASVFIPYPPFTVIAYNVRRYILIERVDAPPVDRDDPTNNPSTGQALTPFAIEAINMQISSCGDLKTKVGEVLSGNIGASGAITLQFTAEATSEQKEALVECLSKLELRQKPDSDPIKFTKVIVQTKG